MLIEKALEERDCLAGEVVVITGAGRGIGEQTAIALAYLGASIGIAEISDSGRDVQDRIRSTGGKALWLRTDIADPMDWARLRGRLIGEWGKVDMVINNAEAVCPKAILEHSLEEWERVFAVNCRGVFLGIKQFLPDMLRRHHGVIVFMPSAQGMPYVGAYSASKAAQESLSSSLAQEIAPGAGVAVITFGVGMVDTPATQEYVPILASRYGISRSDFVAMAAPGGKMASTDLVATALAGVIVHASELHGQQVDWPQGLALVGLDAAGAALDMAATEIAPAGEKHVAGQAVSDVSVLAQAVEGVVKEVRGEFEALGVFQKQWYRRTIRSRTGMDLDAWEKVAHAAATAAGQGGASAVDAAYAGQLRRLAEHIERSEADWRGYVRDPELLKSGIETLERRKATVVALVAALSMEPAAPTVR